MILKWVFFSIPREIRWFVDIRSSKHEGGGGGGLGVRMNENILHCQKKEEKIIGAKDTSYTI